MNESILSAVMPIIIHSSRSGKVDDLPPELLAVGCGWFLLIVTCLLLGGITGKEGWMKAALGIMVGGFMLVLLAGVCFGVSGCMAKNAKAAQVEAAP